MQLAHETGADRQVNQAPQPVLKRIDIVLNLSNVKLLCLGLASGFRCQQFIK